MGKWALGGLRRRGCGGAVDLGATNEASGGAGEGERTAAQRANQLARSWLDAYQAPPLDAGIEEGLLDFIARRKESMPDAFA